MTWSRIFMRIQVLILALILYPLVSFSQTPEPPLFVFKAHVNGWVDDTFYAGEEWNVVEDHTSESGPGWSLFHHYSTMSQNGGFTATVNGTGSITAASIVHSENQIGVCLNSYTALGMVTAVEVYLRDDISPAFSRYHITNQADLRSMYTPPDHQNLAACGADSTFDGTAIYDNDALSRSHDQTYIGVNTGHSGFYGRNYIRIGEYHTQSRGSLWRAPCIIGCDPRDLYEETQADNSTTTTAWINFGKKTPGHLPGPRSYHDIACNGSHVSQSVDRGSGNYIFTQFDPIATRGYPLRNNITVNSQIVEDARPLGNATVSYDIHILNEEVWSLQGGHGPHRVVVDGDGTRLDFGSITGSPVPEPGVYSQLVEVSGGYELRNAGAPEDIKSAGNFTYQFDEAGKLLVIIDPNGNHQTISYDGDRIQNVSDVNTGKFLHFIWSGDRISEINENNGATTHISYIGGNIARIEIAGASGVVTSSSFGYRASDGLLETITLDDDPRSTQTLSYTMWEDQFGNPLPKADIVNETGGTRLTYEHSSIDPLGTTVKAATEAGGTIKYQFNRDGDLTEVVYPPAHGASAGARLEFTLNGQRQVEQVSNGATTYSYEYNGKGLVTDVSDNTGGVWHYGYNGVNLATAEDAVSRFLTLAYDANSNVPRSFTDGDGQQWQYQYNAYKQRTQISPPGGSPSGVNLIEYHEGVSSNLLGMPKRVTNAEGDQVFFDAYDSLGDVTNISTSPDGVIDNTKILSYDALQRSTTIQHADGKQYRLTFNGLNLNKTSDENGTETSYDFCPSCGVLEKVSGPLNWSLTWAHNADHDLTDFQDARTKHTQFVRGKARELTKIVYPDGSKREFFYDNFGRLREVHNARGDAAKVSYDKASRVSQVAYTQNGPTTVFHYNLDGTLHDVADGVGTTTYAYYPSKQLKQVTYNYQALGLTTEQSIFYTYYPDQLLATTVWKSGTKAFGTWSYEYDGAGRVKKITGPNGVTTYSYDHEGKLKSQVNSNGTKAEFAYNEARGWPSKITNMQGSSIMSSFALQYDQGLNTVGNLTTVTESGGATRGYAYDGLYRLQAVEGVGGQKYKYDLAGNLLTLSSQVRASYDDANKIIGITGGAAGYDADGNLTSISATGITAANFSWDARDKLLTQTAQGTTTSYGYEFTGKRVWSQDGGQKKKFYIFSGDLLIAEVAADGMPKMIYSWGANGLISQTQYNLDSISRAGSRGKTLWYHYGPQGETRQLTNSLGAVVDSYTYTAYGSLVSSSGSDINPFKFGGKYGYYTDGSSGIMLAGQRWYHPVLSRWLSRDPIGYDGGENLYGYVGGNPVGLVDPSGRMPIGLATFLIGAAIGGVTDIGIQLYHNQSFDMSRVNFNRAGWSAFTGGIAGFLLATPVGTTYLGIAEIGAVSSIANYQLTTEPRERTLSGYICAAGAGAVGGMIGGKVRSPTFNYEISPLYYGYYSSEWIKAQVALKSLASNFLGSFVSSYSPPEGASQD